MGRLSKEEADRQRNAMAMNGVENPRVKLFQAMIEDEGAFLRDYARVYGGYIDAVIDDGYADSELLWEAFGRFVHTHLCSLDAKRADAMMELTLGDIASIWARAAGGMRDLQPDK